MKAIMVATCRDCPSLSRLGAFAREPLAPYCANAKRVLPHVPKTGIKSAGAPVTDYAIPDWCPLPDVPEPT